MGRGEGEGRRLPAARMMISEMPLLRVFVAGWELEVVGQWGV